jgi:arylsulfatase A
MQTMRHIAGRDRMPRAGSGPVAGRPSRPLWLAVLHAAGSITRVCGLILAVAQCGVACAERPPNVVMIVADDLGYAELGCYGQQRIRTPRVDRLASQGMRLLRHYAGNAVCAPSRCVLMTGKHPGHTAIRDNRSTPPEGQFPLPLAEVTLAELLRARGYATGAFGKWGLGGPGSSGDPLSRGFDRFFGYRCQGHAHSYYPGYLWDDDRRLALNNQPPVPGHAGLPAGADAADPRSYDMFKGQDYSCDRIQAAASAFIRDHRHEPFFLLYASPLPHLALHIPDDELAPYHALQWDDPPFVRAKGGYTPHFTPRAAYAAMVSRLDREVGVLLDELESLGLADDTLVIFTSDNGSSHVGDEVDVGFFQSVGGLRGLKGSLYEGGIRVPCIVRWPSHVMAGSASDVISGFEDWLPTLVEVADRHAEQAAPAEPAGDPLRPGSRSVDGVSLLSVLEGRGQPARPHLYREFAGYGGQQCIIAGRWKAVRQQLGRGPSPTELYDLVADPSEAHDVSAEHPDVVARLEAAMRSEHSRSADFPIAGLDIADLNVGAFEISE